MALPTTKPTWLLLAITSGACAAFNGVFAKLTTTTLTTSWSSSISQAFNLPTHNKPVEYAIRGLFFGLNLLFNAIMWGLFTRALTLASSTVRVSIINTSANFIVTAVLSYIIFAESLPGLWWLGAAMLVTGSVIIGMREEKGENGEIVEGTDGAALLSGEGEYEDEDEDKHEDEDEGVELRNLRDTEDESSGDEEDDGKGK